jgi:hypothetical protein
MKVQRAQLVDTLVLIEQARNKLSIIESIDATIQKPANPRRVAVMYPAIVELVSMTQNSVQAARQTIQSMMT